MTLIFLSVFIIHVSNRERESISASVDRHKGMWRHGLLWTDRDTVRKKCVCQWLCVLIQSKKEPKVRRVALKI